MIVLPEEIQYKILKRLTLTDIVNCRLVCKVLKKNVDRLLSRVKNVKVEGSDDDEPTTLTSAFLLEKNVPQIIVSRRCGSINRLIIFLATHCPDVQSIEAYGHVASTPAMQPLSAKLIYFSLEKLTGHDKRELTADILFSCFPNLMAFDIRGQVESRICYRQTLLCANKLMELYHKGPNDSLKQMTICGKYCPDARTGNSDCKYPTDEQWSSIRAVNILGEGIFHPQKHCPQICNSLEFVQAGGLNLDFSLPLAPLSNLMHLCLTEVAENFEDVVNFLMQSPKLQTLKVLANIVEENAHSVRSLMVNCESLSSLIIHSLGGSEEENNEWDEYLEAYEAREYRKEYEENDNLGDFEEVSLPIGFNLKELMLSSSIGVSLINTHSQALRRLKLHGPVAREFTFNLPNLVEFSLLSPRCNETIHWLLRNLRHSTYLERLVIGQINKTRRLPDTSVFLSRILKIDVASIEELVNLFAVAKSIREVKIEAQGVFESDSDLKQYPRLLLDLSSHDNLRYFRWDIENYPIRFNFPKAFQQTDSISFEEDWPSNLALNFNNSRAYCRVAIGPDGVPLGKLDDFTGEVHLDWHDSDRESLSRSMLQISALCPKVLSINLKFVDFPEPEMQRIIDSLLEGTHVQKFFIICEFKGSFPKCLAKGLEKHSDRLQTCERLHLNVTCDEFDERSRGVINSLVDINLFQIFTCKVPLGKYELDESKSLVFKDNATVEKELDEFYRLMRKESMASLSNPGSEIQEMMKLFRSDEF